ncbi:hypothetical protein RJ639_019765 [Escallonia herrerae]|uniref:Uncharacterized protein n=1 Tax=Escallonia herrerae TaxID=1293975 RepID=A0AA88VC09_9ASTE|nr:hypothetical protein RJ639_019765 [Escallonia herrerae]
MNNYRRSGFVAAFFYLPLLAIPTVRQTEGRELRPADHGLTYQETPTSSTENSAELSSFFGRGATVSNVPLPEARNMSDPAWWSNGRGGGGGGGRTRVDHVKVVLLVASLVCGTAGVVLLAVAASVFLFRFQKRRALIPTPTTFSSSLNVF